MSLNKNNKPLLPKSFSLAVVGLLGLALAPYAQPMPTDDTSLIDTPASLQSVNPAADPAIDNTPNATEDINTNPAADQADRDAFIAPKGPMAISETTPPAADDTPDALALGPTSALHTETTTTTVSTTSIPQPMVYADIIVSNVTVAVPNSTGVERQKALEVAARQALPAALALMNPPVTGSRADTFITTQGDLTRYVKTVRIIKEILVPTYTLTADLTFSGPKLYANLGGYIAAKTGAISDEPLAPAAATSAPLAVSASHAVSGSANPTGALHTWPVQLASSNPAEHARLLHVLNQLPNTQATYTGLSTNSASYQVVTPLSLDYLEQALTAHNLATMPGPATGLRVSY